MVGAINNNNIGIASIGGGVTLMGIRAADNVGNLYRTREGVSWAVQNGAKVINMSYSSTSYIKADSIFLNYDLAQDLHDDFTQKQEAYMTEYSTKRQTFENEAAAFQEKVQRGGFLTEQRAVQERDRLLGKEQEILQLDQDLTNKLAELQAANNQQLLDSLLNYIGILNAQKQYDYIFEATDILIGNDAHNFTAEVLAALNARYNSKR